MNDMLICWGCNNPFLFLLGTYLPDYDSFCFKRKWPRIWRFVCGACFIKLNKTDRHYKEHYFDDDYSDIECKCGQCNLDVKIDTVNIII